MDELLDDADHLNKGRPVLLTVLCILTWTGSALQFAWAGWMIFDVFTSPNGLINPEGFMGVMALFGVASILTTIGTIRLFRLRKGLIIYFIGELVPPAIFITMLVAFPPGVRSENTAYMLTASILAISALFIFLYVWVVLRNKALFRGRVTG